MRTHRTHRVLAPWSVGAPVLDAERLAAVRIEPVLRQRRAALLLDVVLADGERLTVVPSVLGDPGVVVDRDRDPLIWPHGFPGDDALALALADRILPHLTALVLEDAPIAEHVLRFGDAPAFDAARAAGCFGAAPLRDALVRLAPYAYARRYARGRSVLLDAADAIGGWALLRDAATVAVAPHRRDPAQAGWYGAPPERGPAPQVAIVDGDRASDAPCVVRLDAGGDRAVPVVDPLPLDAGLAFDLADGPAVRTFALERTVAPALRRGAQPPYAAVGGSSGRIAIVPGRADALALPSADTDEARALVAALAAEGFSAELVLDVDRAFPADLVHVVGTRDGRRVRALVDRARSAGIPVALHAHDEDPEHGGWWLAAVARYCFEYGADERDVTMYLGLLARRAVSIDEALPDRAYAPADAGIADATAALRDATVVFAAGTEEAERIGARTGRRGPVVVVPPLAAARPAPAVPAWLGSDPFALVHAPVGPQHNQLLVARAAADARIPLVVAGPVADASYLERVREFGGPDLVVAPEPAPAEAAALVAAAAVVIDAAAVGEGGSRLAAAALTGARLAVADRRAFVVPGADVRRFDAADLGALTRALGEAWDAALRAPSAVAPEAAGALSPAAVVRGIVAGYAAAAGAAV